MDTHNSVTGCSIDPHGTTRSSEESANAPHTISEHFDPEDTQYPVRHHDSSDVPVGFDMGPMQYVGYIGWCRYESIPSTNLAGYSLYTNEQATNLTTIGNTADTTTTPTHAEPTSRVQHTLIDRYEPVYCI
jgi:hypothetical protein